MGRHQTEAAYLKSVLLWLQGNWAEPDPPRFYPLREVEQASRYHSVRRTHAALNRRDVIIDQRYSPSKPDSVLSLNARGHVPRLDGGTCQHKKLAYLHGHKLK